MSSLRSRSDAFASPPPGRTTATPPRDARPRAQSNSEVLAVLGRMRRHAKEKSLELLVVGKGSNVLFDDRGFDGLVVVNRVAFVERAVVDDHGGALIRVGAGMPFDRLGWRTVRDDWSGLEFATGIPGTVGGAVFMNAGANGSVSAALRVARLGPLGPRCCRPQSSLHQDGAQAVGESLSPLTSHTHD
jgi:hypothetical protein